MHDINHTIRAYQAPLHMLAYRMLGDWAQAEDIVQEAFIKLTHNLHTLDTSKPLHPWLIRVTVNLSRDALRHRQSQAYIGPWLPAPAPTENLPSSQHLPTPLQQMLSLEGLRYKLMVLFELLSPTQRAVLILRKLCHYSTRECADTLELSEDNVKTSLSRAMKALHPHLEHDWPAPSLEEQHTLSLHIAQLVQALMTSDLQNLEQLLHHDMITTSDAGGEFSAALKPILGAARTLRFLISRLPSKGQSPAESVELITCNGLPTLTLVMTPKKPRFATRSVVLFQSDGHMLTAINIINKSSKINHLI